MYVRYCPYAHDLARAKRLVAASGTTGQAVTVWVPAIRETTGDYLVSVLQSLGYKAKLKLIPPNIDFGDALAAAKGPVQAGFGAWGPAYPSSAAYFSELLTCAAYKPGKPDNINYSGFCNPGIDREIARAIELQASDPNAASLLWSKIDREVVDQAPWVTMANSKQANFVSNRVGNYQYNPVSGVLLDQLWVR
jgi:peptide/nickel transport system substrate-binding protein